MAETRLEKIYQEFSKIRKESESDCSFDKVKMDNAFNISSSLSKWIGKKIEWTRLFKQYEIERKKKWKELYEYYQTDYPFKISTKEEYNLYIESNENYTEPMMLSSTVKEIILFIDSTIDCLKTKSFDVKNFIQWNLFINGQ